jgi:hypothetical protein
MLIYQSVLQFQAQQRDVCRRHLQENQLNLSVKLESNYVLHTYACYDLVSKRWWNTLFTLPLSVRFGFSRNSVEDQKTLDLVSATIDYVSM